MHRFKYGLVTATQGAYCSSPPSPLWCLPDVAGPLSLRRSMKSILDPSFRYVPSHATDVRQTFERIRREADAASRRSGDTVVQIKREKTVAGREAA